MINSFHLQKHKGSEHAANLQILFQPASANCWLHVATLTDFVFTSTALAWVLVKTWLNCGINELLILANTHPSFITMNNPGFITISSYRGFVASCKGDQRCYKFSDLFQQASTLFDHLEWTQVFLGQHHAVIYSLAFDKNLDIMGFPNVLLINYNQQKPVFPRLWPQLI